MKNPKLILAAAAVLLLAGWGFIAWRWLGSRSQAEPSQPAASPAPAVWDDTHLGDSNDDDRYIYSALFPVLRDHPAAEDFNRAMTAFVQAEIERFIQNSAVAAESNPAETGSGSMLDIQYGVLFNRQGLFSVVLQKTELVEGFERPGEFDLPINYDLGNRRVLALKDLFLPDADFYPKLADLCTNDLKSRIRAEDQVTPLTLPPQEDTFRAWHLTPAGLEMIFNFSQLGTTTASGSLSVLIPYDEISALIDPKGPLSWAIK